MHVYASCARQSHAALPQDERAAAEDIARAVAREARRRATRAALQALQAEVQPSRRHRLLEALDVGMHRLLYPMEDCHTDRPQTMTQLCDSK